MIAQADLFETLEPPRAACTPEDDLPAWEARFLRELAERPCVACYPGWTGAMHETLVERGHASREDAGLLEPLPYVEGIQMDGKPATLAQYERWCRQLEPTPQYRYAITEAGRAILSALEERVG